MPGSLTRVSSRIRLPFLERTHLFIDQKNVNLAAAGGDRKILTMQGSATFTAPTDVAVTCDTSGAGAAWSTDEGRFTAIKVGGLVEGP